MSLRIASVVGFTPYWGKDLPCDLLRRRNAGTVGGGEEAALETAHELAGWGHEVHLWWYGQGGKWDELHMHSLLDDLHRALLSSHWDAVIGWSTLRPLEVVKHVPNIVKLYAQQLNDLFELGDWSAVDCIVSPSVTHSYQLPFWGWRDKPCAIVHNGVLPERYAKQPAFHERPLNVGYWSSPDRGLHYLLRAWPEVTKREPTARLHVFYEIDRFLEFAVNQAGPLGDRARLLARELPIAKADPTIIFRGAVDRETLAEFQVSCRVQAYSYQPLAFCEGFGTAVAQGIMAGCNVLLTPHDAFPELYHGFVTWLPEGVDEMQAVLAPAIVKALHEAPAWVEEWEWVGEKTQALKRLPYTWAAAGEALERALDPGTWKRTAKEFRK